MKKLSMVFLAVLIATALTSTTFAYGWGGGWGRGHARSACDGGPGYERDIQAIPDLGLTAEQTAKIREQREAHLKDVKPLHDKIFSKRGELKLLWLQKTPDREKITAVQKEIGSLRDQMQDKMTSNRLDMFNVLTPEQRTKFQAVAAERGFCGGCCTGGFGTGPRSNRLTPEQPAKVQGAGAGGSFGRGCCSSGPGAGPRGNR